MKKITLLALLVTTMPTAIFAQQCTAVAPPYTLNFEAATTPLLPDCTVNGITSGSQWITSYPGGQFNDIALQYTAGENQTEGSSFYSQRVLLTAGNYYKVTYTYGSSITSATQTLTTTLNTGTSQGDSVTSTIGTHTTFTAGMAVNFTSAPVYAPTTGEYYIGFTGVSATAGETLYVDNITVTDWTCGMPTNVNVSDISTTGATFSWTAATDNTSYQYFYWYSTSADIPGGGPGLPQGVTTITVNDLQPDTTYYVFTRNQCGPLMSDWTEAVTFTTPAIAGLDSTAFSGFKLFPNPVKDILTLNNSTPIDKVSVYNVMGQLVLEKEIRNTDAFINVNKLSAGTYMIDIVSGNVRKNTRFVKQ